MRLPRWKREQKEKKICRLKAKIKFLLLAVILAGIIAVSFFLLKIYTASVLPKNGRVTVIFSTSPLKILTFEREGKVVFLRMPDNFHTESIEEFLGAPVDGWLGPETNLSLWDRFRVWWKIKSAKTNLVQTIDLQKINPAKLDLELSGVFKDANIFSEHLAIEVLNGSNKPEMANRAARLITNLGGTVISVGNSEKENRQCEIKAAAEIFKSQTAQRLKKIFNCREILLKSGESRADLQLIIGLDYWQKMNPK